MSATPAFRRSTGVDVRWEIQQSIAEAEWFYSTSFLWVSIYSAISDSLHWAMEDDIAKELGIGAILR